MLIQILNGLVYGGLLYILAVGLVLIFGLRRVVNFAHGGLFMIGAYVGYSVALIAGFWIGVVAAIVILAVLGALLDISVFRTLQRHDPIVTVLVTFGILLVLEDVAQTIWGKDFLTMAPPAALSGTIQILDSNFPAYRLLVIAVAAAVAVGLSLWLRYSRIGLFVRASSVDPITTAVQGVNTDRVSIVVVAIGTALAGLSGTIAAPLLPLSPAMGAYILIDSFIVVVVGGLRSFSGAFVAALVIGQIHNFGVIYVPWAATMIPFVLMVAVLIWRPTGMAGGLSDGSGGKVAGGDALLEGATPAQARALGRAAWIPLACSLALGFSLPALISSVLMMTLLTQAVISGVLATGVGFLVKQNGAVSFGHAAYFGLSAYTITLLLKYGIVPAEVAIVIALAVPAVLAFLLGLVIVRIPGVAFSMLTLAVGQALHEFVVKARHVAGGDDGLVISLPQSLFGTSIRTFQDPHSMFVVCWIALVLLVFGLYVLVRSPFGQLTEAIRENEERARFIGYRTVVPRSLVYALSALIAALAGALFALYNAFVSPEVLHWSLSGSALIMAIIGGPKLLWGPAFGAVIFFFLKNLAGDLTEHWQAMIGVILILVTVLLPTGLAGALVRGGQRLRGKAAA